MQNMKKFIFNKKVLIVLVVGLVLIVLVSLFLNKKAVKYETVNLVKTELYVDPEIADQAAFVSQMPYRGSNFEIQYVPQSGYFLINLSQGTVSQIEKSKLDAWDWIRSNKGMDGKKFCGLKYGFNYGYQPEEVRNQITNFFPGCEDVNSSK